LRHSISSRAAIWRSFLKSIAKQSALTGKLD
jgi:hypothetical protein